MNNIIDMSLMQKAIDERRIHVFKNPFPDLPKWEKFMPVLHSYMARDQLQFPDENVLDRNNLNTPYLSFQLRCRFWSRLTFQLYDGEDPLENHIPELMPVLEWARSQYGERGVANTFALVSLIANRGQIGHKHEDYIDQFQWQCIGTSIWRTGDNLESENLIEPGDFIFVPKNIQHEIETVTPRAVINLVME